MVNQGISDTSMNNLHTKHHIYIDYNASIRNINLLTFTIKTHKKVTQKYH